MPFRLVVNAGTRDKDLDWIRARVRAAGVELAVIERSDLAMIAVQGPQARALLAAQLPAAERAATLSLEPFFAREVPGAVRRTARPPGTSRAPATPARTASR